MCLHDRADAALSAPWAFELGQNVDHLSADQHVLLLRGAALARWWLYHARFKVPVIINDLSDKISHHRQRQTCTYMLPWIQYPGAGYIGALR